MLQALTRTRCCCVLHALTRTLTLRRRLCCFVVWQARCAVCPWTVRPPLGLCPTTSTSSSTAARRAPTARGGAGPRWEGVGREGRGGAGLGRGRAITNNNGVEKKGKGRAQPGEGTTEGRRFRGTGPGRGMHGVSRCFYRGVAEGGRLVKGQGRAGVAGMCGCHRDITQARHTCGTSRAVAMVDKGCAPCVCVLCVSDDCQGGTGLGIRPDLTSHQGPPVPASKTPVQLSRHHHHHHVLHSCAPAPPIPLHMRIHHVHSLGFSSLVCFVCCFNAGAWYCHEPH